MNRDDLLKKCVDRGVADETSIGSVSHLLNVYLLSALRRGQRVEVPNFGTFSTRVVGVKRARKMPIFEVEAELADKVNERYRNLKYLVVGRYELFPAVGDEEFKGKEAPHDELVGHVGKEMVLDTQREVTSEEYEKSLTERKATIPSKEKRLMPKLNLKEEAMEGETRPGGMEPHPPTLHESEDGGRGPSALLQVLIAIIILGLITFALNYFGVIHLWGEKPAQPVQATLPAPKILPPVEPAPKETTPTPTPVPIEGPKGSKKILPPSGVGNYTVQVSSWMTKRKAEEEASRLVGGGLDAFVESGSIAGEIWHRVRVGRYPTQKEAATAASQLQDMLENHIFVARVSSR
jgi:hypothetical protein